MVNESQTSAIKAIAEQAACWYLDLDEGEMDDASRRAFISWLSESPAHIEEFMRVRATHALIADTNSADIDDIELLLQNARSNVVTLSSQSSAPLSQSPPPKRKTLWAAVASIAIIAAFVPLSNYFNLSSMTDIADQYIYETSLGEQRSVLLGDGSIVELNTESKLQILFSDDSRLVRLLAGEAVFDVAKDPQRKFRVEAGTTVVEALGTRFNVYRQDLQTVVTVVEGRVAVSRSDIGLNLPSNEAQGGASAPIELDPGGQIVVSTAGVALKPAVVDAARAVAWTQRRLVFDNDSLAIVARELNRYNQQQLTIADSTLASQSISGVFDANDPEILIAFLETIGNVQVDTESTGGGWVVRALPEAQSSPVN